MRKIIIFQIFIISVILITGGNIYAHPGRTASDGCHYCRTNCDSWGVPWNQRHCHNGYTKPVPVSIPKSTVKPKYESKAVSETQESKNINSDTIDIQEKNVEIEQNNPVYTAQIQDKIDDSNNWIYLLTGIILGGLILSVISKVRK